MLSSCSSAPPPLLSPSVERMLSRAVADHHLPAPSSVQCATGYCNELFQVHCENGETLMLKRATQEWVAPRLRASRVAAGLLRRRTGVLAPQHVDVHADARGRAVEAYWRIPLPTLADVWPHLPERQRPQALRSWGALLRRVHKVKLRQHGTLEGSANTADLGTMLHRELTERLVPALATHWPSAAVLASELTHHIDDIHVRCRTHEPVLVHNDFHMGNVLCERRPRSVRCSGVIDLETAWAGPPEADVARLQVLQGEAFGNPLGDGWSADFLDGYCGGLDQEVLSFFRALDRLNLGYFAATKGWSDHVCALEAELRSELRSLARRTSGQLRS